MQYQSPYLEEWHKKSALRKQAHQLIEGKNIAVDSLNFREARAVIANSQDLNAANYKRLKERWSLKLQDEDKREECLELAQDIADYFAHKESSKREQIALAKRLNSSTVRPEIIIEMIKWARDLPQPDEQDFTSRVVEWKHPQERQLFHYAVRSIELSVTSAPSCIAGTAWAT